MGKTGKGGAQDGKLYFDAKFDHFKQGYARSVQNPPVATNAPPTPKQNKDITKTLAALDLKLQAEYDSKTPLLESEATLSLAQYFVDRFRDTLAPKQSPAQILQKALDAEKIRANDLEKTMMNWILEQICDLSDPKGFVTEGGDWKSPPESLAQAHEWLAESKTKKKK